MTETKWYEKSGNEGDIVISSRIRLARNLTDYPFPIKTDEKQKGEIEEKVKKAMLRGNSAMSLDFTFIPLKDLSDIQAVSLVEKHMASPEFVSEAEGRAIIVSKDESVSIMINEEDHLRIQVMHEGLSLEDSFETADKIDTLLNESLNFAFDTKFGFLTQCPTNLGTGMRASVMLHLPALTENGVMPRIGENLAKLGITVRGTYGEGTRIIGAMYQISNQITLGLSEKEALENLRLITIQLIGEEKKSQQQLVKNMFMQDKLERAAGILKNAKVLSSEEFISLISYVRLGLSTGILSGVEFSRINSLVVDMQPGVLTSSFGENLSEEQRDIKRAELVREALKEMK